MIAQRPADEVDKVKMEQWLKEGWVKIAKVAAFQDISPFDTLKGAGETRLLRALRNEGQPRADRQETQKQSQSRFPVPGEKREKRHPWGEDDTDHSRGHKEQFHGSHVEPHPASVNPIDFDGNTEKYRQ